METYYLERRIDYWLNFLKEKRLNIPDFELMRLAIALVKLEGQ
jgi:hypothetical protein